MGIQWQFPLQRLLSTHLGLWLNQTLFRFVSSVMVSRFAKNSLLISQLNLYVVELGNKKVMNLTNDSHYKIIPLSLLMEKRFCLITTIPQTTLKDQTYFPCEDGSGLDM